MDTEALLRLPALHDWIASALAVIGVLMLRVMADRAIAASRVPEDTRLRWRTQVRTALLLMLIATLVIIWATQLRAVALSIAAFAAAIVLSTKELLQCWMGYILRASTGAYAVGDRIEVDGTRGDVIDIGVLTTTVIEVGPGPTFYQRTGRKIVIPNSTFLANTVTNESFTNDYVLHFTRVVIPRDADALAAEAKLLEAASAETAPFALEAAEHFQTKSREHGLDVPSTAPQATIALPDEKSVQLVVRFPAPAARKGLVEQAILRRFVTATAQHNAAAATAAPPAG